MVAPRVDQLRRNAFRVSRSTDPGIAEFFQADADGHERAVRSEAR